MMKNQRVIILGGVHSGKTDFAEEVCQPFAKIGWWGTAVEHNQDELWQERLQNLKGRRDERWTTFEGPWAWPEDDRPLVQKRSGGLDIFVMDCLNLWLAAHIHRGSSRYSAHQLRAYLEMEFSQLCASFAALACPVVIVSAEVGAGVVPAGENGRLFRDLLSIWNCRIVKQSDYGVSLQAGRAFLWPAGRNVIPEAGAEVRCVEARHLSRLLGVV